MLYNIRCTVNMGVTVSEQSFFPTSFGRSHFQGNLFSFEKQVLTDFI